MKNIKLILAILITVVLVSCTKENNENNYPECIDDIIASILGTAVQTPRANITKYTYKGKDVFVVAAQNFPDGEASVMSENCVLICFLGGIDGQPSAACSDYFHHVVGGISFLPEF